MKVSENINENVSITPKGPHTTTPRPSSYATATAQQRAEWTFSDDINETTSVLRRLIQYIRSLITQGNSHDDTLPSNAIFVEGPSFNVTSEMNDRLIVVTSDNNVSINLPTEFSKLPFSLNIKTTGIGAVTINTPQGYDNYELQKLAMNRGEGTLIFRAVGNGPSATPIGDVKPVVTDPNLQNIEIVSVSVDEFGRTATITYNVGEVSGADGFQFILNGQVIGAQLTSNKNKQAVFTLDEVIGKNDQVRLTYTTSGNVKGKNGVGLTPFQDRLVNNNSTISDPTTPSLLYRAKVNLGPIDPDDDELDFPTHQDTSAGAATDIIDQNGNVVGEIYNIDEQQGNDLGHPTGDNSGAFPDTAIQGYFFTLDGAKRIGLRGLNDAHFIILKLFGSRENQNETHSTVFTVGNVTKSLFVSINQDNTADFYNVRPNSGEVEIVFANGLSRVGFFNAIEILAYNQEVTDPGTGSQPPMVNQADLGPGIQRIKTELPPGLQTQVFAVPSNYKILWDNEVKQRMLTLLNDPVHADEKDEIENHSFMMYRAVKYLLYGNSSDASAAISRAKSYLSGVNLGSGSNNFNGYGTYSELSCCALVFSWLRDTMSQSDINYFVDRLERLCWDNTKDPNDSPIFPRGSINDIFGNNAAGGKLKSLVSHHLSHLISIFWAAVAIAPYRNQVYQQVARKIIDEVILGKYAMNRLGLNQGTNYTMARSSRDAAMLMTLEHIAKAAGATNTKYFDRETFAGVRAQVQITRPDGKKLLFGDTFEYRPSRSYETVGRIAIAAAAAEDEHAYDFAYTTGYNRLLINNTGNKTFSTRDGIFLGWLPPIILSQKPFTRKNYRSMPDYYHAPYPAGVTILRGGMDIRNNNVGSDDYHFAIFHSANIGNHNTLGQGHVSAYLKGPATGQNGAYNSSTGEYNSDHVVRFFSQGISCNIGYSHHHDDKYKINGRQNKPLFSHGQEYRGTPKVFADDILGSSKFDNVLVRRVHVESGLCTLIVDTTKSHNSEYAKKVSRLVVAVATGNSSTPFIYLTQDYFENSRSDTGNYVLHQSVDDISVDSNAREFWVGNNMNRAGVQYNAKEYGKVFGDGSLHLWDGWHVDRNSAGSPTGNEYPPGQMQSHRVGYEEIGGKRADIRSVGKNKSEIIVLHQLVFPGVGRPSSSEQVNAKIRGIDTLGVVTILGRDQADYDSVSFELPGTRRVLIPCLSASARYQDQNGNVYNAKSNFFFDQQLPAGQYTIMKSA